MPVYSIKGVNVDFPYEAYPIQIEYMFKIISCLDTGSNGLLESPTGTGKTLSLLCSILSWIQQHKHLDSEPKDERNVHPKVVYTSRTHSQLSQTIGELFKTSYKPKLSFMGSRDHLCRNPDVMRIPTSSAKIHACSEKIFKHKCSLYSNVKEALKSPSIEEGILDIEDLVKISDKHSACPYYISKELNKLSDIIMMPYSYLIDPNLSRDINLEGTIIVVDEAHNIETCSTDSYSFCVTSSDLEDISGDILQLNDKNTTGIRCENEEKCQEDYNELKTMTTDILKYIRLGLNTDKENTFISGGSYILNIMRKSRVYQDRTEYFLNIIEELLKNLLDLKSKGYNNISGCNGLVFLRNIFEHILCQNFQDIENIYKVVIKKIESENQFTLDLLCLDPSLAFSFLKKKKYHSIILTGGTLSPLDLIEKGFGVDFRFKITNKHVVKKENLFACIINRGKSGNLLDSSYTNRLSVEYLVDIGRIILDAIANIDGGILVFFPSYYLLNESISHWKKFRLKSKSTMFETISDLKYVFIEDKDKHNFSSSIQSHFKMSETSKGSIFLSINRGKLSEGIDFSDNKSRCVIIVGVPYPSIKDPKIFLKREYMDVRYKANKTSINGNDWYLFQALKSVNQSMGRIIRHREDFGAILLLDYRFSKSMFKDNLPSWVKDNLQIFNDPDSTLLISMCDFFKKFKQNREIKQYTEESSPDIRDTCDTLSASYYYEKLKVILSQSELSHFKKIVISFDSKEINVNEMMLKVRELFNEDRTRVLFNDFLSFIPKCYHI